MCYCAKFTNYSTVSSVQIVKVLKGFSCLHAGKTQKKKMKEAFFFSFCAFAAIT